MSLPLTLSPGLVAVQKADNSINNLNPVFAVNYGTITDLASDVTTRTVGDFVGFINRGDVPVIATTTGSYYIVKASDILYKENPAT